MHALSALTKRYMYNHQSRSPRYPLSRHCGKKWFLRGCELPSDTQGVSFRDCFLCPVALPGVQLLRCSCQADWALSHAPPGIAPGKEHAEMQPASPSLPGTPPGQPQLLTPRAGQLPGSSCRLLCRKEARQAGSLLYQVVIFGLRSPERPSSPGRQSGSCPSTKLIEGRGCTLLMKMTNQPR